MNETIKVSAVDIAELYYGDCSLISGKVTGTSLAALLVNESIKKLENIHQDTWTLEESEAQQDSYRNQLTGKIYRMGRKQSGELTAKFTIGRYSYAEKAEFLGGTVSEDGKSWERSREEVDIYKLIVAKTWDNQYCVLPYANIKANEGNSDKAIGISVTATAMEPQDPNISIEYWFDASVVK